LGEGPPPVSTPVCEPQFPLLLDLYLVMNRFRPPFFCRESSTVLPLIFSACSGDFRACVLSPPSLSPFPVVFDFSFARTFSVIPDISGGSCGPCIPYGGRATYAPQSCFPPRLEFCFPSRDFLNLSLFVEPKVAPLPLAQETHPFISTQPTCYVVCPTFPFPSLRCFVGFCVGFFWGGFSPEMLVSSSRPFPLYLFKFPPVFFPSQGLYHLSWLCGIFPYGRHSRNSCLPCPVF